MTSVQAPRVDGSAEFSAERYFDEPTYTKELGLVFGHSWLVAARLEELPAVGWLVRRVGGREVVITRDQLLVRAFHNVCSHRGTAVADGCSQARRIRCPFHGWTYDLAGQLVAVPHGHTFGELDLTECSLASVKAEVWCGWVWVRFDDHEDAVASSLEGFADEIADYRLESAVQFRSRTESVPLNWKAALDAFNETYHVSFIHSETVAKRVDPRSATFAFSGPHSRTVLSARGTKSANRAPALVDGAEHGSAQRGFAIYTVFPNTIFHHVPAWCIALQFEPVAVGRTEIRANMVVASGASDRELETYGEEWRQFSTVLDEDLSLMESHLARGMRSPAFRRIRLGSEEARIAHFHQTLDVAMRHQPMPRWMMAYGMAEMEIAEWTGLEWQPLEPSRPRWEHE